MFNVATTGYIVKLQYRYENIFVTFYHFNYICVHTYVPLLYLWSVFPVDNNNNNDKNNKNNNNNNNNNVFFLFIKTGRRFLVYVVDPVQMHRPEFVARETTSIVSGYDMINGDCVRETLEDSIARVSVERVSVAQYFNTSKAFYVNARLRVRSFVAQLSCDLWWSLKLD